MNRRTAGNALLAVVAVLALLSAGAAAVGGAGAFQQRTAAALHDRLRGDAAAEGALAAAVQAVRTGTLPGEAVADPVAEAMAHGQPVNISTHPCDPSSARYLIEDRGDHLRITAVGHGCRSTAVVQAGGWSHFAKDHVSQGAEESGRFGIHYAAAEGGAPSAAPSGDEAWWWRRVSP